MSRFETLIPFSHSTDTTINIGIEEANRKKIAEGLSCLLADSYTLYLRTHNFHWNVTGPMFLSLHWAFEKQYSELALAVDEIAERIRALGFSVPATYVDFSELASLKEERGVPSPERMISLLVEGHEVVIQTARKLHAIVEESQDAPTADLLAKRMFIHEKTAWMLRSITS